MTCQHCQTWILDVDHRCRRCGRRVRSTPPRISPATYPIAASATAAAYEFTEEEHVAAPPDDSPIIVPQPGQQPLFTQPVFDSRVIPIDQGVSPAMREAIRARAEEIVRPAPLKTGRVEVRHARPQKRTDSKHSNTRIDQRRLEFEGEQQILSQPQASIICDAPVAPVGLRARAALFDGFIMAIGCVLCFAMFAYVGGEFSADKHILPFFLAAVVTVPFLYKLLWTFAGQDTIGMQRVGLRLVDFDGNPPSTKRRYLRLFGGVVSLAAAGIGLVWVLVDEDTLTWHDHMSNTFPTLASDE
jgi:uncharacterized RDD family membrane protein YckC